MMPSFTILEQVLEADRYRQRVSERRGGYAIPALGRRKASPDQGPFLVTNARSRFVMTRLASDGFVNYGFSPVPSEENPDALLLTLYHTAASLSGREGWPTRCSTVREAIGRLRGSGIEPRSVILSATLFREVCGIELQAMASGYVTRIEENIRIFVAGLPEGAAIVLPSPAVLGTYTRVGEFVGVVIQRANRAMMVVGRDMA